MSEREIPQELAREAFDLIAIIPALDAGRGSLRERAIALITKLDALEQPEDPAEVAAMCFREHDCGDSDPHWSYGECIANHLRDMIRNAYAKREKAVRELSEAAEVLAEWVDNLGNINTPNVIHLRAAIEGLTGVGCGQKALLSRNELVKELSNWIKNTAPDQWAGGMEANARVRREFGWDKE